jgi:hypothetical protein
MLLLWMVWLALLLAAVDMLLSAAVCLVAWQTS